MICSRHGLSEGLASTITPFGLERRSISETAFASLCTGAGEILGLYARSFESRDDNLAFLQLDGIQQCRARQKCVDCTGILLLFRF